jgi:pimeloyl-ACP methyl ester carboxylesterase
MIGRLSGKLGMIVILAVHALAGSGIGVEPHGVRSFVAKGVNIQFLDVGKGDAVVLLHGLHSSVFINWTLTGIVDELARDHRVIAVDLPGHGLSDKPAAADAYGLQLVEDVVLLLEHLGVRKAHIVGYSAGGIVALKLLARHPEHVLSGTLCGMGWLRDGSPLQGIWEHLPARKGPGAPPAFIHGIAKLALTPHELKQINVPVMVIIGGRDPIKAIYVTPLQQARNDWPVVEIADAGHINCLVKPQFREEIAGWIRKQPLKKG